jgi:UDP-N-acetylglucosamine diphosphorylase/glucosamine-1-phosphate N-acetyltransferase
MRVCLFEDRGAEGLEPLSLTRPVFHLLCGQGSLGSKQVRHFAPCTAGALVRPHLADLYREQYPASPVNDLAWLAAGPVVMVNGRWLPPAEAPADLAQPCVALADEEVAYAVVGPAQVADVASDGIDGALAVWRDTLPRREAGGMMVRRAWDLVERNAEQLRQDFGHLRSWAGTDGCPDALAVVGPRDAVLVDPSARLDPLVVADTTRGPVVIDREAVVHAFTRLEGPCYVGPHTHVLGAKVRGGCTFGPHCRVGGEVEASVLHGYSNKYHDGFLGHSYVGEWVNLGAGTSNSDLRNDYGEVTVVLHGDPVRTGLSKVGSFIGDHTKSGLGTLLNTGSNIGMFCNLLPAGPLMPKYLPPYTSWWNGSLKEARDLPGLLETAAVVMSRRGCAFTAAHARLYAGLFDRTAPERRRAIHESDLRRLRRSA